MPNNRIMENSYKKYNNIRTTNNKQKLQILEAPHIRNIQPKHNRIKDFKNIFPNFSYKTTFSEKNAQFIIEWITKMFAQGSSYHMSFGWVLRHINDCRLFNAKSCLHVYGEYIYDL